MIRVAARRNGAMFWLILAFPVAILALPVLAGDWPTYRHDIARSGVTEDGVTTPLVQQWVHQPRHAPQPAWGDPNPRPVGGWHGLTERRRMHFDNANHVVVSGNAVYFGSSADGRVVSLDAATGQQRWDMLTGGPVRLAPTIWNDSLYVGSDDGYVYCLRAADGDQQWKFHAAPSGRKVLGSGKMISLWPVRTSVLVDDGIAYFGAGIFPAEGVYLYAVNAKNGQVEWCNDSCAVEPQSRISPQGYLLASDSRLFTPLGRVSPAAFDRRDGELLYSAYTEHIVGGSQATLAEDQVFTGTEQIIGYDQASYRSQSAWVWGHRLIITPDTFFAATGQEVFAVDRKAYSAASLARKKLLDRKRDLTGQLQKAQKGPEAQLKKVQSQMDDLNEELGAVDAQMASGEMWRMTCDCDESLILAGDMLFAGGEGKVTAFDATSGHALWTGQVDGTACGLAAAGGRLFVSSDTGAIYCFAPEGAKDLGVAEQPVNPSPYPVDELTAVCAAAAEHIVRDTGIRRGYCLVLGCGTGRLALELAKRTDLQICAVESDREKAKAARKALNAAGVYGARVLVEHSDLRQVPFSDYFANLIVSEQALVTGRMPTGAREAFRMLKPLGGTICIGQPAAAKDKVPPLQATAMQQWASDAGIGDEQISDKDGLWLNFRRGALPGAGSWTHQYANPGNTTCSDDELVRCPLGTLWFGNPGPGQMAERHRRAAAPLAVNGRMFVLGEGQANRIGVGENTVRAYDAYNGLKLWERSIRGALRVSVTHDSGNSAANEDSLFVAVGDQCLRFDAATGETVCAYEVPPAADAEPCKWGYVAVVGDTLYGSRTIRGRTAECIFAYDLDSGRLRWKHETPDIGQGSIAIGDGKLFFAASSVDDEQREAALADHVKEMHHMNEEQRASLLKRLESAAVYRVVALDALTGDQLWEKPVEVTGASGGAYWCSLGSIYQDDVLVPFGVFLDGHYWTQFLSGQFEQRQVVALSGTDGGTLWRDKIGYRVRPIVVGDTLHAEPWAFDLHTGQQRMRMHPVTGREEVWQFARPGHHCGCPAAAPHMLLFRSYNLGWYDLDNDYGTQHFGGQRPGCWINFVPANGLLLMPEASSGCMCPFPNICTVVFQSRQENRQWAYFSQPGPMTPVKRLALNLGAPGDRKDNAGLLWLGYPRPRGSLVLQFDVGITRLPGGDYFTHDPARLPIEATDSPWIFQSGVNGLQKCVLPVAGSADGTARYTVRLAFAELDHNAAGKRVFDIKIQDQLVAENFDIFLEAGGKNRALVREFAGIEATDTLTVEFIPRTARPTPDQLPILQGIDVQREKVLTLGLSAPEFLLNDAKPAQTGELVIVNNKESDFTGTLRTDAPDGFTITPPESQINLPAGQRVTVDLTATVDTKGPADDYSVEITLVGADGVLEHRVDTKLEYLGNVQREVVQAVEDTHAQHASPTTNYAAAAALNVDGGDRGMGDHHHSIGYLKFPLGVEGKLVSATLRIYNAGNPTGNSGQVRLVAEPWDEKSVTYDARPKLGAILAEIGAVTENEILEIPLQLPDDRVLQGDVELSLAIDPTGCDGVNYISREGGKPAELIVEYSN